MDLQKIDLNVWDKGAHEGIASSWQIHVYPDMNDHSSPELIVSLNPTQVEMLGLRAENDHDWWTDPVSFLHQHDNIPRKVRRIFEGLEELV